MDLEFYTLLAERIKSRRKELKLTQTQVCGDYMTRNMLSRIENGCAHPSLDTLVYIADKLNMPVEYFVSRDRKSASLYKKAEHVDRIRGMFESHQFKRCIEFCRDADIDDVEIHLIKAESELRLAIDALMNSRLRTADRLLTECAASAEGCLYNADRIRATVDFYRQLIKCIRENKYPDRTVFKERKSILVDQDFILFVFTLSTFRGNSQIINEAVESINDPIYKSFLCAEAHISNGQFENAKPYLRDIVSSNPGFFTRYFTVQNLELCYKETDDFKSAYEYAKMRLDLLDKFND